MKKLTRITKAQVLEAIANEPLWPGNWVALFIPQDQTPDNCNVCAVGAVLRHKGLPRDEITQAGDQLLDRGDISSEYWENIPVLLKDKLYLNALSVKFEYLCEDHDYSKARGLKTIRKKLAQFVEENFPNSFDPQIKLG